MTETITAISKRIISQNSLRGYPAQIARATDLLKRAATDNSKSLYQRNQDVYNLPVWVRKVDANKPTTRSPDRLAKLRHKSVW